VSSVVTVSFAPLGRTGEYSLDSNRLVVPLGSQVVVEGFKGIALGRVISEPHAPTGGNQSGRLRKVVRSATEADLRVQADAEAREGEAFRVALVWIREQRRPWKLVRVVADGLAHKMTFCIVADERQDVRDAGKALGRALGLRALWRQIGPRDVARTLGGLGRCGKELCCSTFLPEYPKTSIRMAKDQNLALSPERTSGVCGKTLCCLAYEHDSYLEHRKWLPRLGKRARTVEGLEGKVVSLDVLKHTWVLRDERGRRHPLTAEDWDGNQGRQVPAPLSVPIQVVPMPGRTRGRRSR
jgi:cell fate regulator YaaT (PSP1 superfamily)